MGRGAGGGGLPFGCARHGGGVGRLGCALRLGFPDGEAEGDWGLQDVPENPFDRLGECALHDPLGPFIWRGHHGDPVDEEDGLDLPEHAAGGGGKRRELGAVALDPRVDEAVPDGGEFCGIRGIWGVSHARAFFFSSGVGGNC